MDTVTNWDSHPDKLYIDLLANHKDGGRTSGTYTVVDWVYKLEDGKFRDHFDQICCQKMPSQKRDDVVGYYFSLRKPSGDISAWWWKNLFDPNTSPWHRLLVEGTTLFEHENAWVAYIPISKDTLFKDIVNLNIATRQPREYPASVKRLKDYADERPHYTFAEALAMYSLKLNDRYHKYPVDFCSGHGMFNQSSAMNLVGQRNPHEKGGSFNSSAYYYTSDEIWSAGTNKYCWDTGKKTVLNDTGWSGAFDALATAKDSKPPKSVFARRIADYENNKPSPTLTEEQAINLIRTHGAPSAKV